MRRRGRLRSCAVAGRNRHPPVVRLLRRPRAVVAFLFVLVGVKFLEARHARDGTLLVCLAMFLLVTPFLYSQSMLAAALRAAGRGAAGRALDVLARRGQRRAIPWRVPLRRAASLLVQGLPIAALLFVLFPRLAAPLWGLPADTRRAHRPVRPDGARHDQRRSRCRTRSRSASSSTAPRRRRRCATGAARAFALRRPRVERDAAPSCPAPRRRPARGARSTYTVTLEPNDQPWLFALDLPAGPPRVAGGADGGAAVPPVCLGISRDQQLLARAPVDPATALRAAVGAARSLPVDVRASRRGINLRAAGDGNPRTIAFARSLRERHPDDADYIRAVLRNVPRAAVRLHARAAAATSTSRRPVHVRRAARLLRALRERVRRPVARGRHPGARRDRLPGRRDQSDAAAT